MLPTRQERAHQKPQREGGGLWVPPQRLSCQCKCSEPYYSVRRWKRSRRAQLLTLLVTRNLDTLISGKRVFLAAPTSALARVVPVDVTAPSRSTHHLISSRSVRASSERQHSRTRYLPHSISALGAFLGPTFQYTYLLISAPHLHLLTKYTLGLVEHSTNTKTNTTLVSTAASLQVALEKAAHGWLVQPTVT